ncbi:MAG: hypothetical protein JO165_05885, partial [Candidatus Eremiobacteraeota bacterium]|nr:hypothetical protein [Candidatus Eremiobacteraeota bacterium]
MIAVLLASALMAEMPGWTPLPLKTPGPPEQYAHYQRTEADGTTTEIVGARQKCECQPSTAATMLGAAVAGRSAVVKRNKTELCGVSAEHVLVTGIANREYQTHNIDQYFLRKNGTFYALSGYFDASAP